jgi:hypothetical protein
MKSISTWNFNICLNYPDFTVYIYLYASSVLTICNSKYKKAGGKFNNFPPARLLYNEYFNTRDSGQVWMIYPFLVLEWVE